MTPELAGPARWLKIAHPPSSRRDVSHQIHGHDATHDRPHDTRSALLRGPHRAAVRTELLARAVVCGASASGLARQRPAQAGSWRNCGRFGPVSLAPSCGRFLSGWRGRVSERWVDMPKPTSSATRTGEADRSERNPNPTRPTDGSERAGRRPTRPAMREDLPRMSRSTPPAAFTEGQGERNGAPRTNGETACPPQTPPR